MDKKRLLIITAIVAAILLIPLIAMQFTDEVNWNLGDFLIGGSLLFALSLLIDVVVRKIKQSPYRFIIIATILVVFILIWAELAVGIFGTPFAGD